MMRTSAVALAGAVAFLALATIAVAQDEGTPPLPKQKWSFAGPFGTYDRAALQRGFGVYQNVCENCHELGLIHFGDLGADGPGGGIGYNEEQVKAIAAASAKQYPDTDDSGQPIQRPGRPTDTPLPLNYDNVKQAKALFGTAPPDLSLIVKAREGGADYVYAFLSGFSEDKNKDRSGAPYYNEYFPGHNVAMPPPPLAGNDVPGVKATADEERRDVVTFLSWASEPTMEDRKRTGIKVLIFLIATTGVLYFAKRQIWASLH
ncbi:MAG TPA: cytochrome c1 [Stellaceae bacterium]|nr:cytochrome c1 [Stellaceae bacterium]